MHAAEIEARLDEWRRWCLLCGRRRGQSGSAEGNRSPQHWDPVTWAPQMRPIAHRAYQVELVVLALSDPFHSVLVMLYIKQTPESTLCHIVRRRWKVSELLPVLDEARRRVGSGLACNDPRRTCPSSLTAEMIAPASIYAACAPSLSILSS